MAAAALVSGPLSVPAQAAGNTSQFKGVNWTDPRDNFVNGPVFNEPNGYSDKNWDNFAAHYPNVPRGRIVVAGSGSGDGH